MPIETESGVVIDKPKTHKRPRTLGRDGIFVRNGHFYISHNDFYGERVQKKVNCYTLQQARAIRAAELAKVEEARKFGQLPPSDKTFTEIIPQYLGHQKARLSARSYIRAKGITESHLQPVFGKLKISDIRRGDVQRYITNRIGEVSSGSVAKELNTLKHILRLCLDWELLAVNPASGVKAPKLPAGRVRYLQPAELRAVLESCPAWLRPIVALLVLTGMRRSEALGLRWLDVDRQGCRIVLRKTKNNELRIVWLNDLACKVLDAITPKNLQTTDRVFPPSEQVNPENVSLAFLRACRRAKIEDFRLHDLRHTAASWLRMKGADIHTVASLLGHKDLRMAARYQHLSPDYLQTAVRGLDAAFGGELSQLPAFADHDEVTMEVKNASEQVQTEANQQSA
ncbi:MAG TPA: site-specific integrase [Candidatus Sulfotelmatobacter sp.]|nr:site-specific integrase [Candidatus Sulfotelmatobacter sp.]